jgi:ergothioneine biosynthesis protein EgtB
MVGDLWDRYREIRATTERICAPLEVEDYVVQPMADASPAKWHLAHVSWFFEIFVLVPYLPSYTPAHSIYGVLFNSYYNSVGPQHARPARGHLSRPTVEEIYAYRRAIDVAIADLIASGIPAERPEVEAVLSLGLHHEQQHQELLLTDIKYMLAVNPLRPAYHARPLQRGQTTEPLAWIGMIDGGGVVHVGDDGTGFAFDNERPRHLVYLRPYRLASRPVTNGEYLEFVEAGGYRQWQWWLSEGWTAARDRGWQAPLYWEHDEGAWWVYTLSGPQRLDPHAPVCHVSYYEADAYGRWRGKRLPSEHEWEHAVLGEELRGNLQETGAYQPLPAPQREGVCQAFGDVWEWTRSPHAPYPGFRPLEGGLGEYNGKFMVNQLVLRGGSCATPESHLRRTYRNFFSPDARWQFSGIRLAEDA